MKLIPLSLIWTVACTSSPSALEVIVEPDLEVANGSSSVSFEVRTQEGDRALSEQFDLVETPCPADWCASFAAGYGHSRQQVLIESGP